MRRAFHKPIVSTSPPITPTLAWFDPSDAASLTVAGGVCSQMNDKTGNGHDVTAATTARPTVSTIGSLGALLFASPNHMLSAAFTQAQPITLFCVVKYSPSVPSGIASQPVGNPAPGPCIFTQGAPGQWTYYAGTVQQSVTAADTGAHVLDGIFNGAGSSLNLDGVTISSANPGAAGHATKSISFGADAGNSAPYTGLLGEVLYYSSALSAPNRASIEAYLKAKWGTP